MAAEIYMPKNGMDMTEGTLVRWLKEVGEPVEAGEAIMEIETDKVTMEAEAPASGVLLQKLCEDGAVVPVLSVLGWIGQPGEEIPASPAARMEEPSQTEAPAAYQVAVVGGGPAGYVAAIRAAQLGARVVLFEKDALGGTCLNRGCIPTKTLLKTAEYLRCIQGAAARGITVNGSAHVDMPAAIREKDRVVKSLTDGVAALLRSNGVTVVKGAARLRGTGQLLCGGKSYTAENIILCGGSKPVKLPIPGAESAHVLTSTELLNLRELPARLCIIGGGVIGCEFASIFQTFGSQVAIVEKLDRLMEPMDNDISKELERHLRRDGVAVHLREGVQEIVENPDGHLTVVTDRLRIECDKVLLSIGRVSDLECLGDLAGEIRTERGRIAVDEAMRTSVKNIYACGDVNGRAMLAHAAFRMGETAAENCVTGQMQPCPLKYVPSVLYTSPEAASVGLTEEQARRQYPGGVLVGRFPFSANSRAAASGERDGFVKVIAEKSYGELLGVHIIGGLASEMIAEAAALMSAEVPIQEIASTLIHPHPSYSEAFAEACGNALGTCIHLPPEKS